MTSPSPLAPRSFAFEANANIPAIIIQVTPLVKSYMLWVGAIDGDASPSFDVPSIEKLASQGSLAKDWACAMPPLTPGAMPAGTPLFRSNAEDAALSMAQRLARRFNKQIFLSVDSPTSFGNPGQPNYVVLRMEKLLVQTLVELEKQNGSNAS